MPFLRSTFGAKIYPSSHHSWLGLGRELPRKRPRDTAFFGVGFSAHGATTPHSSEIRNCWKKHQLNYAQFHWGCVTRRVYYRTNRSKSEHEKPFVASPGTTMSPSPRRLCSIFVGGSAMASANFLTNKILMGPCTDLATVSITGPLQVDRFDRWNTNSSQERTLQDRF